MNFIDWNYDTGVATQYKRINKCDKCGDCCKVTINLQMVDGDKDHHGGITMDGKGRWSEIGDGYSDTREFVRFIATKKESSCAALGLNNLCSLNGTKSWCCKIWPTAPSDIEQFENCSYKFIEVDNWEFGNG